MKATVDSAPVEAVKNGDLSLIPLKQDTSTGSCKQNVQFIYSITSNAKWTPKDQDYKGPLFGLPLKDIKWKGKKITFERALEIRKDAPLEIKFKSSQKMKIKGFSTPLLFAGLAILFAIIYSLITKKEEIIEA